MPMPTFTAIALDRLLEPRSRNPALKPPPVPVNPGRPGSEKKRIPLPQASPALYTTPETTPLPDSPSSFPPSPYIINHKRRGPRLLKSFSQNDVGASQPLDVANGKLDQEKKPTNAPLEEIVDGFHGKKIEDGACSGNGIGGVQGLVVHVDADQEKDGENGDDFFDLQDTMSTTSNDSNGLERLWKPSTPMGEFFDALEEISSPHSFSQNVEDELREMRLNVLMEIERRKQVEESLGNLQNQWQRLSRQLSLVGLMLPDPPTITEEADGQLNTDPVEELCRQVVIQQYVASSIGRGCSRAEVELETEPLIESKNLEIARLSDRLQYYEAANREMSQRNQEAVELARQQRRKRRQKWFRGSISLTITLGIAALAWSYLPHSKPPSSCEGDTESSHGN